MRECEAVAAGVWVLRYPVLDVNCVLVVGRERALLVDTLSTEGQARELAAAVRRVTSSPVTVVNTHGHFDHWFGNRVIAESLGVEDFWAHESVLSAADDADGAREAARRVCAELAPEIAAPVARTRLTAPNRAVRDEVELDLGGRSARLWHPGPAHSPGDLVVFVDAVTIAGDLVEEGAPPSVGADADPVAWARVLGELSARAVGPVIPGHGAVVDAAFVARQGEELAASLD